MRKGVTWLSDDLLRVGAHDDAQGSDGLVVVAYLLSRVSAPNKPAWETSAAQMSEQFGWGRNREPASRAIDRAVKDHRLVIRSYLRDGQLIPRRCAYVVCAGGRRFTDEELLRCTPPIAVPSKPAREVVQ
ncbi:hypothetical protein B1790_06055 [Mycobacterium sp. AT1]|nr:hypothetical protein B1790_06055 [Mycobacterium sp. AT1]